MAVDGQPVLRNEARAYYLLYKPSGCVTTASDPQGRPNAIDYLKGVRERVFAVGRLDYDAEGALLFTDDGELANRLAHPRYGHPRTYLAKVKGEPHEIALARLKSGVRLEDGPAKALEVVIHERTERNTWIRIVVGEGRFHLVKRLCEAVGLDPAALPAGVRRGHRGRASRRPLPRPPSRGGRDAAPVGGAVQGRRPERATPYPLPRAARRHGHGAPEPAPGARTEAGAIPRAEREARPARGIGVAPSRGPPPAKASGGQGGRGRPGGRGSKR